MDKGYSEIIKTKLVGVTFNSNLTETPRQELLDTLSFDVEKGLTTELEIEEYEYKDEPALAVNYLSEDIGNIKADIVKDIYNRYNCPEFEIVDFEVTGGGDKNYGVNIKLKVSEAVSDAEMEAARQKYREQQKEKQVNTLTPEPQNPQSTPQTKEDNGDIIVLLLTIFLGFLGVYRFIKKQYGMGAIYLFTFGLCGFGWVYDIFCAVKDIIK